MRPADLFVQIPLLVALQIGAPASAGMARAKVSAPVCRGDHGGTTFRCSGGTLVRSPAGHTGTLSWVEASNMLRGARLANRPTRFGAPSLLETTLVRRLGRRAAIFREMN